MSIQIFCIHVSLYNEIMLCMQRKTKELISLRNCTADLLFCFSQKSNHRFHSLSHDTTFTMPRISKCVKIALHLQLIFNCGSVVFWVVAILIWPSLLCPARLDQSAQL